MARQTRTQPWCTLSIPLGNAIQIAGLAGAVGLVLRAPRHSAPRGVLALLAGWLLAYFNGHAIAHWAVGRLGGIHFTAYGLHGTTHPEWYPPGVRWVFLHLPFLSARTDPTSRRAARPIARAAMYAAGPLATMLTSITIPAYGWAAWIPRARALLIFACVWMAGMLVGELAPQSDFRRAWRELQLSMQNSGTA
jgi:hypothetical protein